MSDGIMEKKALADLDFSGKTAIVRVDFNVPLDEKGQVADDTRIRTALPTLEYLQQQGAKIILISHLGRPKGEKKLEFSLRSVAEYLQQLWPQQVIFAPDCLGAEVPGLAAALEPGEILLLENLRFYPEEEANDQEFARTLAALGDIYVNDAFGSSHRSHASIEAIAAFLPSCAGLLLEKEMRSLGAALAQPKRPFMAIIGGAKVADKITVVENLLKKVDRLLLGGGMAYTFLAAQGYEMEKSLVEKSRLDWAKDILALESAKNLVLPVDVRATEKFEAGSRQKVVPLGEIPPGWEAVDIGTRTIELFKKELAQAETIIWNGPVGVFEIADFAVGTGEIARALAESHAFTIIGGGDSASAVRKAGMADKIDHISTGGGASLKVLEGKVLPGIAALSDK